MPITNVNSSTDKGPGGGGRTTFRPPWVKGEGPQPVPMPTTPWSKRDSLTTDAAKENGAPAQKDVKLQSREVKVPVTTTTKKATPVPLKKKDDDEEDKKASGSADKSGKFARPVLKKVAKVEEATKPPGKAAPAAVDKKPVGKSKAPVVEESSSEEEESSYEEVTETETETDSDEPPPISKKKAPIAPAKDESSKQVAVPTKPVPTPVVKPPLTRQTSAKFAPVEKPAIPATHAKFTPPKSPFSKKVVPNKSVEQATPPPEPNKPISSNSKIQNDVQKDLSKNSSKENGKELPKEIPKVTSKEASKETSKPNSKESPKQNSKEAPKQNSNEVPKENSKEAPKEALKEASKELSKDILNKKSQAQAKPVASTTDDKVQIKTPIPKQNSVKPIQSPSQIQQNETATKSEPEITQTTETPKLTTEPTDQKNEPNRPINKKFGLTTGKSTETKSAPEKTAPEKIVPSKQVTLKPIPEKTAQSKTASDKPTIPKPELKPIPPKPEPVPEPKQLPTKSSLKPIPPKPDPPKTSAGPPPPPPPPPGMGPPPPPPPPALAPPPDFERKPVTEKHKQMLEKLKTRPRKRPDWSDMMKEVESGRKLKHVQCNDRSSPIISCKSVTNIQGQYIFETEKANVHNVLLKQIQGGVRLKPTRTNDRSRPILDGLRKFRRQMTIEEQIQKSESRAQLNVEVPVEESEDEMDDIDKLRDDLQSTKQMLALELRNKEAQERENKRLSARVQILEAELEREKWQPIPSENKENKETAPASETLLQSLKKDAEEAQKTSKLLERKYQEAADQLDAIKNENERQKITIANLERRLAQQGGGVPDARRQSEAGQKDSSPEPELELSEEDEDEDEEKKAERVARRLLREVKMMCTKLIRLKDKERAAKRERENLRDAMKKNQGLLKLEHKKFKKLQREVDKMAAMMKDDDEEHDEDDEAKPPAEEPEDEESEEEDEEEESDSEDESEGGTDNESESEAEDATDDAKKANYEPRIKRHDGRVSALKKGNYLLQANVDRLQDEINKMREKSVSLQRDLDSVLSELG